MTSRASLTRRGLLAGLGMAASWCPAVAAPERPRDVGIGGTGFAPEDRPNSDRGIGGTGFVGTIQRFGSIVVNDSRIAYPTDVAVTIDGLVRSARDLRIGHVVRVVARPDAGGLATAAIAVDSAVVGPITAVYRDGLGVLGQRVALPAGEASRRWHKGRQVAVSGLRRLDGTIAASLVEPREAGPARVTGVVERDADGFWIDGLKLLGLDESVLGRRVTATGRIVAGGFAVGGLDAAPLAPAIGPVSLESYLGARDGMLRLGSGLAVRADAFASWLDPSREIRAVLDGRVMSDGVLQVDDIRLARGAGQGDGNAQGTTAPGGFGAAPPGDHAQGGLGGIGQGPGGPGGPGGSGGNAPGGGGGMGPGGGGIGPGGGEGGPGGGGTPGSGAAAGNGGPGGGGGPPH